jgi:hypothetical protein
MPGAARLRPPSASPGCEWRGLRSHQAASQEHPIHTMTGFLSGLGTKLAERWVALLVLPGLIYVSALTAAWILGQRHAMAFPRLATWIDNVAARPASSNTGTILLVASAAISASAVAGLLASALGQALEWSWHRPERRWLSRLLTRRRQSRWHTQEARFTRALTASVPHASRSGAPPQLPPTAAEALVHRNAISFEFPAGPTWIGDRFRALTQRVHRAYALNLHAAWPGLWLLLPDQSRAEISTSRDAHTAAARLGGWATLYLLLGMAWWPALPAAAILAVTSWHRGRRTAAVLAELIEAAVDLYIRDLATQLGLAEKDQFSRQTGQAITDLLEKSSEVANPGSVGLTK